jgi:hypothetical protein
LASPVFVQKQLVAKTGKGQIMSLPRYIELLYPFAVSNFRFQFVSLYPGWHAHTKFGHAPTQACLSLA